MFINPTDSDEILSLISLLKNSKATGPNSIPTSLLKLLGKDISTIFSKLFNLSFITGVLS